MKKTKIITVLSFCRHSKSSSEQKMFRRSPRGSEWWKKVSVFVWLDGEGVSEGLLWAQLWESEFPASVTVSYNFAPPNYRYATTAVSSWHCWKKNKQKKKQPNYFNYWEILKRAQSNSPHECWRRKSRLHLRSPTLFVQSVIVCATKCDITNAFERFSNPEQSFHLILSFAQEHNVNHLIAAPDKQQ